MFLIAFLAVGGAFGLTHRTEVIELLTFHTSFPICWAVFAFLHRVAFLYRFVCSWVDATSQNVAQASSHLEEFSRRLFEKMCLRFEQLRSKTVSNPISC